MRALLDPHTCRVTVRTVLVWPVGPPQLPRPVGAARRRGSAEPSVDGDATPIVRPYYVAHEARQRGLVEVTW
ncbi:hypothetical protein QOM21_13520 [Streptomyces sp. Pv4-95]|uniref:hypothetical protein n=1 Tax=Streptomyces sp. Pv4-95 TaxID=3049543 RepID=UPI0038918212